ncbi:hypothetical protein CYY_004353 [Polysphondylium violaceum]|uniref:ABC transporter domain-containing protein n=1 Tax=Polysphondylium violaceum TaxID=133409 RepID=A0A8J4PVA4_9MYCE|nr:hypothetical protein CYY_004353 [Polysphondylium violaceum]
MDKELGFFQIALKQTLILLKKNFFLSIRKKVTTAIQLSVPFFFIVGLYLIQLAVDDAESTNALIGDTPNSIYNKVELISKCKSHDGIDCFTFIYSPNNTLVNGLIDRLLVNNQLGQLDTLGFKDSYSLNEFILNNPNKTQAAYVFQEASLTSTSLNIVYDIQYNSSCINRWRNIGACPPPIETTIAPMQVAMDKVIIEILGKNPISGVASSVELEWSIGVLAHPKTKYYNIVTDLGSIFFFASLMFQLVLMLQDIIAEKENRLKEGMRMMGLKEIAYYVSWFLTYTVYIVLDVFVLIASGFIVGFKFFLRNDFGTYFCLFILFGLSIICFAFFLCSLLSKSQVATFLGFFLFILFSILQAFIPNLLYIDGKPYSIQAIFSLFSPIVFAKGLTDLAKASDYSGLRWKDIGTHTTTFPLILVYRWIVLDGVIFILLGWYIDNVFPGEFGTPKPFYFFLLPSYWTGKEDLSSATESDQQQQEEETLPNNEMDEDVLAEERKVKSMNINQAAVLIKNLRKVYRHNMFVKTKKDFCAVKGTNLSIENNQLFALLGPNGCGKTTTLNMLTGLFGQTSGDAFIFGKSIKTQMSEIRKFMGNCPQKDLLWSHLTGREHIELYAAFKNIPKDLINKEVEDRLQEVGIIHLENKRTHVYSAGEKRRLSVAIAMTGSPKIVFLDEPTTGMDTVSKHQVWDIIERAKKDKVIILTTHYMEECEAIGDRVGIMVAGRLKCLGDNLHLKNKFGTGYRLTIYMNSKNNNNNNNNINNNNQSKEEIKTKNDIEIHALKVTQHRIISFVTTTLQGAKVFSKSNEQIIFTIPRQRTQELPYFLETLEVNQNVLGIDDIDVNLSSLEEVFLKIAEDSNLLAKKTN